jgi:hypothetical protein
LNEEYDAFTSFLFSVDNPLVHLCSSFNILTFHLDYNVIGNTD